MNAEKRLLTKLEMLDAQIQRMKARRRKLIARQSGDTRKVQSRKRFLAGAAILRLAERDPSAMAALKTALEQSLVNDRDRELFGLAVRSMTAPRSDKAVNAATTGAAGRPPRE